MARDATGSVSVDAVLGAPWCLSPQRVGGRVFFVGDAGGRLSLYTVDADAGGRMSRPLLPASVTLPHPHLTAKVFHVFPRLRSILVMLDREGDERYRPMLVPIDGGDPTPAFDRPPRGSSLECVECDSARGIAYVVGESRRRARWTAYQGHVGTGRLVALGASRWGCRPLASNATHTRVLLRDTYAVGDDVLYEWRDGARGRRLVLGVPLEDRLAGETVRWCGVRSAHYTSGDRGLVLVTALVGDHYGLGYFDLRRPGTVSPVAVAGTCHGRDAELMACRRLGRRRYGLEYNVDGASWLYEGTFREAERAITVEPVLGPPGRLADGVIQSAHYDRASARWSVSHSTATRPTNLYTVARGRRVRPLTRTRFEGVPGRGIAAGEPATFASFDGRRVPARLYRPPQVLGFAAPWPLVYYVHGGPHGQERPDFAWFSMPLIQALTLVGCAVFVPNVRGSGGYGLDHARQVLRDWGGADRLDHVHAMTAVLPRDARVDLTRAAVIGRSYGGYMALLLATRHPELWRAAVDLCGPFDLSTMLATIPESWKPEYHRAVGDPARDGDDLRARSPRAYLDALACPLLVVHGRNDPRVAEAESRALVEDARARAKTVTYLTFDGEGHGIVGRDARARCYRAIVDFVVAHGKP